MSHNLYRLASSLYNKPQLICAEDFNHIAEYVESRTKEDYDHNAAQAAVMGSEFKGRREPEYLKQDKIGIIDMSGPITYKPVVGMSVGENLNHLRVIEEAEQLLDMGATTIVLDQDSGGGEASHTFQMAAQLRELCDDYGAKLIAYVDGISASASYAYTAVAHEVYMNPDAQVGSIGVLVRLRNINKAMKSVGIEDTYVTAGDSKIPFDKEGEWTESFISSLQERVDSLYQIFTGHVAMWRGLDEKEVINTQAKMFDANKAISLGLADGIMDNKEFRSYLKNSEKPESDNKMIFKPKAKKEETQEMAKLEELQGQVESLQEQLEGKATELSAANDQVAELTAKLEEVNASLEASQAKVEELVQAGETAKVESRKAKLEDLLGTKRAEGLVGIYENLEDAQFDKLFASYEATQKAEEQNILTQEVGDEGDKEAETVSYKTAGDILREQREKAQAK